MKKTNLIVSIIVSIVCVISGVFIFMPNNNVAFESYYKEIKKVEEYQDSSAYLTIEVTRENEHVDFKFFEPKEDLFKVKLVVIPEDASLRFSKTFLSVGVLEEYSINITKNVKPTDENGIYRAGLAASMKNKENEYLIYLEFELASGTEVKEYIKVEVED
ncbi:MAG: hypothetical protein IJV94_01550 [Bacilli bacterium]|nr:hypothetical protein [Bacilli bacterium]